MVLLMLSEMPMMPVWSEELMAIVVLAESGVAGATGVIEVFAVSEGAGAEPD
jgi:hypothetical protein